jgi:DNA-binding MarR family transcriptional regulator
MPLSAEPRAVESSGTDSGEPPAIGGVLGFLRGVWALDHALQRVSKRMEAERGLTGQQRLLVRVLSLHPRLAPGQLAEMLHLDPSTVTGIVKRLEQRGFLRRLPDPRDGRRVIVVLTARGAKAAVPDERTIEALAERALAVFPRKKIEATEEVLQALTNVLEREVEDDGSI